MKLMFTLLCMCLCTLEHTTRKYLIHEQITHEHTTHVHTTHVHTTHPHMHTTHDHMTHEHVRITHEHNTHQHIVHKHNLHKHTYTKHRCGQHTPLIPLPLKTAPPGPPALPRRRRTRGCKLHASLVASEFRAKTSAANPITFVDATRRWDADEQAVKPQKTRKSASRKRPVSRQKSGPLPANMAQSQFLPTREPMTGTRPYKEWTGTRPYKDMTGTRPYKDMTGTRPYKDVISEARLPQDENDRRYQNSVSTIAECPFYNVAPSSAPLEGELHHFLNIECIKCHQEEPRLYQIPSQLPTHPHSNNHLVKMECKQHVSRLYLSSSTLPSSPSPHSLFFFSLITHTRVEKRGTT